MRADARTGTGKRSRQTSGGGVLRVEKPILTMAFNLDRGEGLADPSAENPVDGGSESLYVNANL